jgi:hypothetical protein
MQGADGFVSFARFLRRAVNDCVRGARGALRHSPRSVAGKGLPRDSWVSSEVFREITLSRTAANVRDCFSHLSQPGGIECDKPDIAGSFLYR